MRNWKNLIYFTKPQADAGIGPWRWDKSKRSTKYPTQRTKLRRNQKNKTKSDPAKEVVAKTARTVRNLTARNRESNAITVRESVTQKKNAGSRTPSSVQNRTPNKREKRDQRIHQRYDNLRIHWYSLHIEVKARLIPYPRALSLREMILFHGPCSDIRQFSPIQNLQCVTVSTNQSKLIPKSLSTVCHSAAKIEYQSNSINCRVQAKLFYAKKLCNWQIIWALQKSWKHNEPKFRTSFVFNTTECHV